ncbi:hypothetical protein [Micromonospora sp. LOL_024]|uniref:hypothetical protein n=1 Tax=Micromonospora sp. LOL_024 TaxID=3345412 RepID=UPI003A850510
MPKANITAPASAAAMTSMLVLCTALYRPDERRYCVNNRAKPTPTAAQTTTHGTGNTDAHTRHAVGVNVTRIDIRGRNGTEKAAPITMSATPIHRYT